MKSQSVTDRTLEGMLWVGGGIGGQALLQIILLMILARILTPPEFGIVTASVVISGLGLIFTEIGVGPSIVQKQTIAKSHIRAGFLISVSLGVLMAYLINDFRVELSELFGIKELRDVIPFLALIYVIRGISVVSESLLQKELQFKKIAAIEFVSYLVGYGATGVSLAYHGYSYWSLVFAQLAYAVLRSALFISIRRVSVIPVFSLMPYRELLHYGLGFTVARIANYVANQSDKFIIGRYLGEGLLGIYGRSYQLAVMPINLLGQVLYKVAFPILSGLQDEDAKLRMGYEKLLVSVSFLALPISCILFVVSDEMVLVVLGEQWSSATSIFRIMVIGLLFRLTYRISDSLLNAVGKVYKRALRQIIYALLILIFSYIGSKYGVDGVAIGVLMAVLINTLMTIKICLNETNNSWSEIGRFVFYGYRFALIASIPVVFLDAWLDYLMIPAYAELFLLLGVWLLCVFLIVKYVPDIAFRTLGVPIINSVLNSFPLRIRKLLSVD